MATVRPTLFHDAFPAYASSKPAYQSLRSFPKYPYRNLRGKWKVEFETTRQLVFNSKTSKQKYKVYWPKRCWKLPCFYTQLFPINWINFRFSQSFFLNFCFCLFQSYPEARECLPNQMQNQMRWKMAVFVRLSIAEIAYFGSWFKLWRTSPEMKIEKALGDPFTTF